MKVYPVPCFSIAVYYSFLYQVLRSEVSSQIHNLPGCKRSEAAYRADGEPFNSFIRALVRVS